MGVRNGNRSKKGRAGQGREGIGRITQTTLDHLQVMTFEKVQRDGMDPE